MLLTLIHTESAFHTSFVSVSVCSIVTCFPFKFQNQLMSLKLTKLTVWITVSPQAPTQTTRPPRLPQHPPTPGWKWGPCSQQLKMPCITLCGVTGVLRIPPFCVPKCSFSATLTKWNLLKVGIVFGMWMAQNMQVSVWAHLGLWRASMPSSRAWQPCKVSGKRLWKLSGN